VRTKRFTTIAGTRLRQALATIAIQLAAFKLGGMALLFGQIAEQQEENECLPFSPHRLNRCGFRGLAGCWPRRRPVNRSSLRGCRGNRRSTGDLSPVCCSSVTESPAIRI